MNLMVVASLLQAGRGGMGRGYLQVVLLGPVAAFVGGLDLGEQ